MVFRSASEMLFSGDSQQMDLPCEAQGDGDLHDISYYMKGHEKDSVGY